MASKNVETFRSAHQAFNQRKFDAVLTLLADDFVYEDFARGVTYGGKNGFREFMQGWASAFSNAEVNGAQYTDGGDTVVAEFTGRGTNDGPLGPMPKTGKQLNLRFCELMRFNASGQIISGGVYYDQVTLLTQLGHMAPAGATR